MKMCVEELESTVDQRVLRWFEHVGCEDVYLMAIRLLMSEVNLRRVRGREDLVGKTAIMLTR